jgi:hypothetical protein
MAFGSSAHVPHPQSILNDGVIKHYDTFSAAQAVIGKINIGTTVYIEDRLGYFKCVAYSSPDGYSKVDGDGSTKMFLLSDLQTPTVELEFAARNFGIIGDGSDESAAWQAFALFSISKGAVSSVASGDFYIASGIDLTSASISAGFRLIGAGSGLTRIYTDQAIDIFTGKEKIDIKGIYFEQTGTRATGKVFTTPSTAQAAYCNFEDITIKNFRYGFLFRYSLWNSFKNIRIYNTACGFRFARNNDMTNQTNPEATGGWNVTGGWFHNQLSFDNILIGGGDGDGHYDGEVGIWGSLSGASLNNVTCQNQRTDGSSNVVLPAGVKGTSFYFEGGKDDGTQLGRGIKMDICYSEFSQNALIVKNVLSVQMNGGYIQGGANSGVAQNNMIDIEGSTVIVRGVTGFGYWGTLVTLTNPNFGSYGNPCALISEGDLPGTGVGANSIGSDCFLSTSGVYCDETGILKIGAGHINANEDAGFFISDDTQAGLSFSTTSKRVLPCGPDGSSDDAAVTMGAVGNRFLQAYFRDGIILGTETKITFNNGSPEGVVTAGPGSLCLNLAGGPPYQKSSGSGNTGWVIMT